MLLRKLFVITAKVTLLLSVVAISNAVQAADTIKILFLGDNGHHQPPARFQQLQPVLKERGIILTYTDKTSDLNAATLKAYDGLMIYANTTKIDEAQEQALIDYVESGKGFIPLHCASYCFLNSQKYIDLVGAQFQKHGTGTFRVQNAQPEHPLMKGYGGFESWDETYVHTKHNDKDRTILEYRAEANGREPWTWVRTQGKGRVFYTAWGHDDRTWANPGFQNLVERGVRWATNRDLAAVADFTDTVETTPKRTDVKPFEYVDAVVPFYSPTEKGSTREPLKKMQKPLDPAESMRHFVTPVGFKVRLFCSDQDLGGKPICMNWDERGRLWVAVTRDYPNEKQPEGQGHDKILICEDTNGDGRADKFTVFADKLSIPTSLIFAYGGVIVTQAPETLFLRDTNGDDKADERTVLFSGWSTGDTHAGPSNLHYGIDNWLYGMVGYAGFGGPIAGESMSFRTGFWRMAMGPASANSKATTAVKKFEFLRNTNNNSWGIGISEDGILFGSTANGNPSEYMPVANRYYEGVRGWSASVLRGIAGSPRFEAITDKIRQVDHHGRFTAAAGHALYTARNYPRQYWNKTAFVAEPTGHLVATFQIDASGADYKSHVGWNLLASDDEWSAPTMAEVGPDGNVWVIDWYNYIVQHNPTPQGFKTGKGAAYETPLRDKDHGRIYRLVYTGKDGKTECQRPHLVNADPLDVAAALRHDNMFWRLHAQRLLVERGKLDILPLLLEMARDPSIDPQGLNTSVVHALWTMHGLGAFDGQHANADAVAVNCLKHKAAGVRRAAVQVLPRNDASAQSLLGSGIVADEHPQVRLAALLALAEMPPSAAAGEAAAQQLAATQGDNWLFDAATSAAARHASYFLHALAAKPATAPSAALLERITIVANHLARSLPDDKVGGLLQDLAGLSGPVVQATLAGLEKGWPKSGKIKLSAADEEALVKLLGTLPKSARGALVNLATRWGSEKLAGQTAEIAKALLATAQDEKAADGERAAAAQQLIEFRPTDANAAKSLLSSINVRTSPQLATGILEALTRSESPEVGAALVEAFAKMTPNNKTTAFRVLLSRGEWTTALLDAATAGKMSLNGLSLDQKQALAAHPNKKIATQAKAVLAKSGGLPDADRQKVIDALLPAIQKPGDPVAGKQIFVKQCAKCHIHNGEGTKIGPDLTGMAVHPKQELIIHIMDPSRSVEGNFRVYQVATDDGRVFNGLLASETKTSIELIDAEAKKQVIQRENIEAFVASTKSLMPEGFEKLITPTETNDLLEFLTQRGKYLPIPIDKVATIVTTRGMFHDYESNAERLIFPDWKPKTFDGVPFILVDPSGDRANNAIMLYSPNGAIAPKMPKTVLVPCNSAAKAIHLLSGVSGWGFPGGSKGGVCLTVRLHFADGKTEDHALRNGEQFADYIRRVDVPGSKFAFALRNQQIRFLSIVPERADIIKEIEFIKGADNSAPIVMAVTVETLEKAKE